MTPRIVSRLAVLSAVAAAAGVAPAQERFTARIDLARFEVTVEDDEVPVTGLTAADFRVTDGGAAVAGLQVQEFSDAPFDMVLVVQPFASHAGDQIPLFAQSVQSLLEALRPVDRLGIVLAARPPVRVRPLASGSVSFDRAALEGTPHAVLFDSLAAALGEFDDQDRRKIVLVVSDGVDRLSAVAPDMLPPFVARARPRVAFLGASPTLTDAFKIQMVTRGGRQLEPEVTEILYKNSFPGEALRAVADETGGQIVDLRSREPRKAVPQLVTRLRSGYLLTFSPSTIKGWHPVSIKLQKRHGTIRARRGYFID